MVTALLNRRGLVREYYHADCTTSSYVSMFDSISQACAYRYSSISCHLGLRHSAGPQAQLALLRHAPMTNQYNANLVHFVPSLQIRLKREGSTKHSRTIFSVETTQFFGRKSLCKDNSGERSAEGRRAAQARWAKKALRKREAIGLGTGLERRRFATEECCRPSFVCIH